MKHDQRQLTQQERELEIAAAEERKLQEMRDYIALAEEGQRKKLELKESTKEERRLARIEFRELRLQDRQRNIDEMHHTIDTIFGCDQGSRGFIARLGAFSFRYAVIYGITVFVSLFLIGFFFGGHPREDFLYSAANTLTHLPAIYFGIRAWRGHTNLAYHHQRFWGIGAAIFLTFTIGSIFVDTSFVKWLFLRSEWTQQSNLEPPRPLPRIGKWNKHSSLQSFLFP